MLETSLEKALPLARSWKRNSHKYRNILRPQLRGIFVTKLIRPRIFAVSGMIMLQSQTRPRLDEAFRCASRPELQKWETWISLASGCTCGNILAAFDRMMVPIGTTP